MSCLHRRGKVYWIVYYKKNTGEKIQRSLKTKDLAVAKFEQDKIDLLLDSGDPEKTSRATPIRFILADYIDTLFKTRSKRHAQNERIILTRFFSDKHIYYLGDVNERIFQDYINARISIGRKPCTLRHDAVSLRMFLNWAVRSKYLPVSPLLMGNIKIPRIEQALPAFLPPEKIGLLLSNSLEPLLTIIKIALFSGMRSGEIMRLRWEDISNDSITVRQSKSGRFRVIPLHPLLASHLKPLRSSGPLFTMRLFPRKAWDALLSRCNMRIRFHDLRHTFASRLVSSGVDLYTVSQLLGHSDPRVTQIYSHITDKAKSEAIAKL